MAKVESSKGGNWGSFGGDTKMHKWSGTGTQEAGQSAQEGTGSKRGIAPKAGPSDVMGYSSGNGGATNKDFAGTQEAGCSAATKSGSNNKFAEGGKTHMWGNRGSQRAIAGQSSQ